MGHHVGCELLVAKDCEAFFETELKPVTAGDAVARPVVKVLMADHGFDSLVIGVCRRVWIGQYVGRIKNIEPFVLHRTHIEVASGHDHETV